MYVAVRPYEEQAERMLIALEGQLQVYEVALGLGARAYPLGPRRRLSGRGDGAGAALGA